MGYELTREAWQVVNDDVGAEWPKIELLLSIYEKHSNKLKELSEDIFSQEEGYNHNLALYQETKRILAEMIADRILEESKKNIDNK